MDLRQLALDLLCGVVDGLAEVWGGFFGNDELTIDLDGEFAGFGEGAFINDCIDADDGVVEFFEVCCGVNGGLVFDIGKGAMAGGDMDIHDRLLCQ